MYVCIFKVHLSREFKTREFDSQFAGSNEAAKECAIKTKVRSFTPLELSSCLKNSLFLHLRCMDFGLMKMHGLLLP